MRAAEFLSKADMRDDCEEFDIVAGQCVGSVLELGCAFGMFSKHLHKSRPYIGIDLSKLAVCKARKLHPGRFFLWGDAMKLGEGWQKVADTVVALQFVEHFADPRRTLDCLRSLARKRMIITVPRGLPEAGDEKAMGHLVGWENWEELAAIYKDAARIMVAPLEVGEKHIGVVMRW